MRFFGAGALPRDVLNEITKDFSQRDFYAFCSVNREAYFSFHPLCRQIFQLPTFSSDQQLELLTDAYMRLHRFTQFGSQYADQLVNSLTDYLLHQDLTSTQAALAGLCISEAQRFGKLALDDQEKTEVNNIIRSALRCLMITKPEFAEIILLLYSINKVDEEWIGEYKSAHWFSYDKIREKVVVASKKCSPIEFEIYIKLVAFIEKIATFDIAWVEAEPGRGRSYLRKALYPLLEVLTKYNRLELSQLEKTQLTGHVSYYSCRFNEDNKIVTSYVSEQVRQNRQYIKFIKRMSSILEFDRKPDFEEWARLFDSYCIKLRDQEKCDSSTVDTSALPPRYYQELLSLIKAHSFEDKDIPELDLLFDELFNALYIYQNKYTPDEIKQFLSLITARTKCASLNLHSDNNNHIPAMLFLLSRASEDDRNLFFSTYFDEQRIRLICKKPNLTMTLVKFTLALKDKAYLVNVYPIFHRVFTENISQMNISVVNHLLLTMADYYLQNPSARLEVCQQLCALTKSENHSIGLSALIQIFKIMRSDLSNEDKGKLIIRERLIDILESEMQDRLAIYKEKLIMQRMKSEIEVNQFLHWSAACVGIICICLPNLPEENRNKWLKNLVEYVTTFGMPGRAVKENLYNIGSLLLECFILIPDNLLSDHIPEGYLKAIQKLDLFSAPLSENYKYHCVPPEEKPEETPEADKSKSKKCVIA